MMRPIRRIAMILALLPLVVHGQSVDVLLGQLGEVPEGMERLSLLARITRLEVEQRSWEEAADLALMGATQAKDLDVPSLSVEFEMVLARVHSEKGDTSQCLVHALRAYAYTGEAGPEARGKCAMFLTHIYAAKRVEVKALDYAHEAIASGSLTPKDLRKVMVIRSQCLIDMNDMAHAANSLDELIGAATKAHDNEHLIKGLELQITMLRRTNDLQGAIRTGKDLLELTKNEERGIVLNNLGELCEMAGDHAAAQAYFNDATTWLYAHPDLYGTSLINTAISFGRQGQLAQAETVIDNAIATIQGRGTGRDLPRALEVKAGILLLFGRSSEAWIVAQRANEEARKRDDDPEILSTLDLLSRIALERGSYLEKQRLDAQIESMEKEISTRSALQDHLVAEQANALDRQEREITSLTSSEQREHLRVREAQLNMENQAKELGLVRYQQQLQESELREQALAREKAQQELKLLQGAMAEERQQRDIQTLRDEQTMQMLQLNKLDLEQKQRASGMAMLKRQNELLAKDGELKAAAQRRDQLLTRFSMGIMVILLGVAVFFFWVYRKVRGKNRVIKAQVREIGEINDQLRDKNEDMMSSISYARNIQGSIIPTEAYLREVLPDSFLLYKPRDIVSGDLPFVRRAGDRLFVAAIDCTGHGVPAAMLSFMAYYNLNDIITTMPGISVGEILLVLHERIQQAVHENSSGHAMSDGMDIGLVELDMDNRVLHFSGAQNCMLVVRNGECTRIRGNNCSIGDPSGSLNGGFTTHRLELDPNDQVYLYSDGFIHQFGGSGGRKKFSNAQLMGTVADLAEEEVSVIGERVQAAHRDWMGDLAQTDDIVLIGFSLKRTVAACAA